MTSPGQVDASRLTIAGTLRGIFNTFLPEGGQRTARRNAWEAVCADRVRARGRQEAWRELDRAATSLDAVHPRSPVTSG
jgi:hypothetical protein